MVGVAFQLCRINLFPNQVSGSDTLNCTFRSRQDNKPYDMWFLLQFKKIPKHVSCESVFYKNYYKHSRHFKRMFLDIKKSKLY